jgi:hypothetical protein
MRASKILHLALAAALVVWPVAGLAQSAPDGFSCTFEVGQSQIYGDGAFRQHKAEPLQFTIAAVNLDAQRAELVTSKGRGPLRIVRAIGANHFLEVVTEGFLNITTIYAKDEKRGVHPAVHSRHFGLFGEPLIAQYTGACKPM